MPTRAIKRIPHEELSTLLKVSIALAGSLDLAAVLQTAIESAVDVLHLSTGSLYLLEGEDLVLGATTPAYEGETPATLSTLHLVEHPHAAAALASGQPAFIDDSSSAELTDVERIAVGVRGLKSVLFVPLFARGRGEGMMVLGARDEAREFTDADLDLCRTLSAQIALAMANAKLFESAQRAAEELRGAYDATLAGWALALELRDEGTSGHTERAAALTVELAQRLGVPAEDLPHIHRGALLHDIGKMAVPDAILKKPGPLTEDEWSVMRKHPEYARRFLSQIDYLGPALDIPYCHHERWNGAGYPQGLRGEEIPLAARIFAVIDVFDALTSARPYRDAWTEGQALAHIQLQAGLHFDPVVVEAFMEHTPTQSL